MSRDRFVLGFATLSLLLSLSATNTRAQKQQTARTPEDKPRKVKTESDKALKEWAKEVGPIITEAERTAYQKLQTNDEREHFIERFWDMRDPDPDTQENEYKDEYYERMTYANEHFTSGKAGWLTDRGRIYLKWGKPDEIETHPAGGSYQSAYTEGSSVTYPFELWFYRHLPGVGSGVEVEFVDPSGSGEYRIARNPFEKEVVGFGNNSNLADRNGVGDPNYRRTQDSPFQVMELLRNLELPPPVNPGGLKGRSHTPVVDDNLLGFQVQPNYFRLADGKVIVAFTIQADNRELVFNDSGGLQTARLNIFAKVLTVTSAKVGAFEDVVETTATVNELAEARARKSVYGKAVILAPGRYRLDVTLRDVASGARGFQQLSFIVPKFETTRLETSSLVLATRLESLKDKPAVGPFMIGTTKVIPNISALYHRGDAVGLYLQVYNAGIDQTTLRPAVDVEYALLQDGKELSRQTEDWQGIGSTTERLILTRLIDTRGLAAGDYEIQIRIRDRVTGQCLSPSAKFKVE